MPQVRGLCGTYSWDQRDDFTTPAGDVEVGVAAFADAYRVSSDCPAPGPLPPDPCDAFAARRELAEAACAVLHGPAFQVPRGARPRRAVAGAQSPVTGGQCLVAGAQWPVAGAWWPVPGAW